MNYVCVQGAPLLGRSVAQAAPPTKHASLAQLHSIGASDWGCVDLPSHPVAADHADHALTLVGRLETFARDLEDECAMILAWLLHGLPADEHGNAKDVLCALKEPKAALDRITECADRCWVWQGLVQVPKAPFFNHRDCDWGHRRFCRCQSASSACSPTRSSCSKRAKRCGNQSTHGRTPRSCG